VIAHALVTLRKSVVNNSKIWYMKNNGKDMEMLLLRDVKVQDPARVELIKRLARACHETLCSDDKTNIVHPFRYLLVKNVSDLPPPSAPPALPLSGAVSSRLPIPSTPSRPRARAVTSVATYSSPSMMEPLPPPPPPSRTRPGSSSSQSINVGMLVPPPPPPPPPRKGLKTSSLPPPPQAPGPPPAPPKPKLLSHFTSTNVLFDDVSKLDVKSGLYNDDDDDGNNMSMSFINTRPEEGAKFEESLKADHHFVDTFGSYDESMNVVLKAAEQAGELSMREFLSRQFTHHVLEPPISEIESIGNPRSILTRRLSDQIEAFGLRDGFYNDEDEFSDENGDDENWDDEDQDEDEEEWGSTSSNKGSSREIRRVSSRRHNILARTLMGDDDDDDDDDHEKGEKKKDTDKDETKDEEEDTHPVRFVIFFSSRISTFTHSLHTILSRR